MRTGRSETFTQQQIDIDKGSFDLAMGGWGSADPHPHFSFVTDFFTHNTLAANNGGCVGTAFCLEWSSRDEIRGSREVLEAKRRRAAGFCSCEIR